MNLPCQFFRMKRSMTKPARKLVGVLSFLFVCFVAASPASAQTPRKVIIGVSNPDNVTFFPLYLAKEAGYFREQGLDPQLIVMNSDLAVKALVTGDVDYAASTASVAKAAALGFPVKIIVSFFNGTDFSLVSKPEIKVPSDLKNKIVAVSRFGSAADFDAREALTHLGLDPAKDVKIIAVGAGPNRLISLLTGKVDAAIINVAESIRAQEQGMRVLISTGKFNRQTLTGLGTATSKITQNRDEVRRVLRAVTRAIDDYKNRKEKIQPLLIKHTESSRSISNSSTRKTGCAESRRFPRRSGCEERLYRREKKRHQSAAGGDVEPL